MKKYVIWDMDGVLVDTGPFHLRAWLRFWGEIGRPFTIADFRRTFGRRNDTIIPEFLGQALTADEVQVLSRRKEEYFREEIAGNVGALPGALELLAYLGSAGYVQALASSAPRENIEFVLRALSVRDRFKAVVAAEDVHEGKPDPEIFLLAAQLIAAMPRQCVVLEDSIAGVQAAKAAGMACIATLTTSHRDELVGADLILPDLTLLTVGTVDGLVRTREG
jgi:beta-phosphoglucomutase